ncbi:MAG: xanthine dehydrogenase small subunit [Pseudomonadota bacterium]
MSAIRFVLNGRAEAVEGVAPSTMLLEWLRGSGLTGSKEGCAEGDCGACTVGLRSLSADGTLETHPACACILPLPALHGREVVTVEHLTRDGTLHPVQAAMAEGHGSQCGFCTPGFVMSLWCAAEAGLATERRAVADQLAGNLCRCTGYGPILDAAVAAGSRPARAGDAADRAAAPGRIAALNAGALDYAADARRAIVPESLDALAEAAAAHPEATIVSGATDVGLWITKEGFDPAVMIFTHRVAALRAVERREGWLHLGAGLSYAAALPVLEAEWPELGRLMRRIGGAQVRGAGTIGGNVANGSPIGDMAPALIALGARLCLRHGATEREIALEDFFIDYGRQDRAPGEIVTGLRVPLGMPLSAHKVSKRFDQDITAVLGCFSIRLEGAGLEGAGLEGARVAEARLAYGGMAGVPKRAGAAEAALTGAPWSGETVAAAMEAMAADFTPLSDMRASAWYRLTVAQNLLLRHFLESGQVTGPTRLDRLAPLAEAGL